MHIASEIGFEQASSPQIRPDSSYDENELYRYVQTAPKLFGPEFFGPTSCASEISWSGVLRSGRRIIFLSAKICFIRTK